MSYSNPNVGRIFVGNLPLGIRRDDVESLFSRYGNIVRCDLREGVRGGYGFIDYGTPSMDGSEFKGFKLKVEYYNSEHRRKSNRGGFEGRGGGGGDGRSANNYRRGRYDDDNDEAGEELRGDRYMGGSAGRNTGDRRNGSGFRVIVTRAEAATHTCHHFVDVPYSASWQDLKDHMREAGNVTYADVHGDGTGTVEYANYDSMQNAFKLLNESKLRSRQGDVSYIRVKSEQRGGDARMNRNEMRQRSRSPGDNTGYTRNQQRTYSPRRSRGMRDHRYYA